MGGAINGVAWTWDEDRTLRAEYKHYRSWDDICKAFPTRTLSSVRHRAFKLGLSRGRPYICGPRVGQYGPEPVSFEERAKRRGAAEHLFEERDRRANEPRTMSQIMFGDPPPSRSALGRPCA